MKAINKILCLLLTTAMLLTMVTPVMAASEATVKMYAVDGRTIDVPQSKVAAYKKVGWYEGTTMYAADGRTTKVSPFKVADYKKVGWYDKRADAYTLLYSADGRITEAPKGKVKDYTAAGWKTSYVALKVTDESSNHKYGDGVLRVFGPDKLNDDTYYKDKSNVKSLYVGGNVTEIGGWTFRDWSKVSRVEISNSVRKIDDFAFDGSKITRIGIPKSVTTIGSSMLSSTYYINKNIVIYCEKGSKAEEFAKSKELKYVYATIIYSGDGRTMMVDAKEKAIYLSSGLWLEVPCVTMYAVDGRTKVVKKTDVAAYKKVGWYDSPVITVYAADGRTKKIASSQKDAHLKVGWFATKPVKMYNVEGKTKYVEQYDVAAAEKDNWYKYPVQTVYAVAKSKVVPKSQVAAQVKVGWSTEPVVVLFDKNNNTKTVKQSEASAWIAKGWTRAQRPVAVSGYGSVTGLITYQYNKFIGTKPDVGADVLLIRKDRKPRDIDDRMGLLISAEADDWYAYSTSADGSGNYYLNNIPEGEYYLIIVSSNNTCSPSIAASNKSMLSAYLNRNVAAGGIEKMLLWAAFKDSDITSITVQAGYTNRVSVDWGYTYF